MRKKVLAGTHGRRTHDPGLPVLATPDFGPGNSK